MTSLAAVPHSGDPASWLFVQLGGDRNRLELSGTAGPMGRPRLGVILEEEIGVRQDEVRYDGDQPPTRHLFGIRHEPFELHGRWSDTYGGKGFANSKVLEVRRFVAEQQQVLVTWADAVSTRGLLEKLRTRREGLGEIEWFLTVLVDSDDLLGAVRPTPSLPTPRQLLGNPLDGLGLEELPKVPPTLRVGIFDFLSNLIGIVGELGNELNRVVSEIRSFATAPLGLLRQLRAAIGQFRTSLIQLRNTLELLPAEYALAVENPLDVQRFEANKAAFYANALDVMRSLDAAERAAEVTQYGRTKSLYTARGGDTFESIAVQFYGSASRAGEIRDANGVAAGTSPVVGTVYLVPE
ncbi:MAG TPA: LysM domain-containing protein [Actinomycetota bacterium]